jgi:hypothetical protein
VSGEESVDELNYPRGIWSHPAILCGGSFCYWAVVSCFEIYFKPAALSMEGTRAKLFNYCWRVNLHRGVLIGKSLDGPKQCQRLRNLCQWSRWDLESELAVIMASSKGSLGSNPAQLASRLLTRSHSHSDRNVRLINLMLSQPHDLKVCLA